MTVLFPPVLENQAPAFKYYPSAEAAEASFEIRFLLPSMVAYNDVGHLQVSLKYANTGDSAVNNEISPDGQVVYLFKSQMTPVLDSDNNPTEVYSLKVPYKCFDGGLPLRDTTYLVQVRFGIANLWAGQTPTSMEAYPNTKQGFAIWRQVQTTSVPSGFGEWSNQQRAYCVGSALTRLSYNMNDFMPEIVWEYDPVGNDPITQVKVTCNYRDLHGSQTKSLVFSGQLNQDNKFILAEKLPIAPVVDIRIILEAVTKNNAFYDDSIVIQNLIANPSLYEYNKDEGEMTSVKMSPTEMEDSVIAKTFKTAKDLKSTYFNVYRINTLTLDCVKICDKQPVISSEEIVFKDYTAEMGEDYQYVLTKNPVFDPQVHKIHLLSPLNPFGPENPGYGRLMRMESTYLTDQFHQLRLSGNVQVSSLKRNVQDSFQTTIGSKYPFYSRASEMNYRTLSLSGLITINFDPTSTFLRLDNNVKIKYLDIISEDAYLTLIQASPGCRMFFKKVLNLEKGNGVAYKFEVEEPTAPKDPGPDASPAAKAEYESALADYNKMLSIYEEIQKDPAPTVALVNRCLSSTVLNGLWWEDKNGSALLLQDRDIFEEEQVSLSRRRVQDSSDHDNEKLVELGKETQKFNKQNGKENEGYPVGFNAEVPGARTVYDDYLYRQGGLAYSTDNSDKMVYIERKFREKVMEWLSNGRPKLFRSETEGNMIVMPSGVSFAPLQNTGRRVYTVSMTLTEIAECDTESLMQYQLLPSKIESHYVGVNLLDYIWGQVDVEATQSLEYMYVKSMDIPDSILNRPIADIGTIMQVRGGKGVLNFSASGLPNGLSIRATTTRDNDGKVLVGGVIHGTPTQEMEPGEAVLTVTDETGGKASVTIHYGYMYQRLTWANEFDIANNIVLMSAEKKPLIVGETEIAEVTVPAVTGTKKGQVIPQLEGGVKPFRFIGSNLPKGIEVEESTGVISGKYLDKTAEEKPPAPGEKTPGVAAVTVIDSVGQIINVPIYYKAGVYPLSFVPMEDFNYDYTEVGYKIPEVDFKRGVIGGAAPYKFMATNLPIGVDLNGNKQPTEWILSEQGILSSEVLKFPSPTLDDQGQPFEGGKFQVAVMDQIGQTASIEVTYKKILKQLKFSTGDNLAVNGLCPIPGVAPDVGPGDNYENMQELLIGVKGIVKEYGAFAEGGLPYTGDQPYRWYAEGLRPNFEIDQAGIVRGGGVVGASQGVATLIIEDARKHTARLVIPMSKVVAGIGTSVKQFTVKNLYQARAVKVGNPDGTAPSDVQKMVFDMKNKDNVIVNNGILLFTDIQSYTYDANKQPVTVSPYKEVEVRFAENKTIDYNGITIERYPETGTQLGFQFKGIPQIAKEGFRATLIVTDKEEYNPTGEAGKGMHKQVQIPVIFETAYDELKWNSSEMPTGETPRRLDLREPNILPLTGVTGGKPPYTLKIEDGNFPLSNFIQIKNPDFSNPSSFSLETYITEKELKDNNGKFMQNYSILVTIEDAAHSRVSANLTYRVNPLDLNIVITKSFVNTIFLHRLTRFKNPVQIGEIQGGIGPFEVIFDANSGKLPGGFTLSGIAGDPNDPDKRKIYISGEASVINTGHNDVGNLIRIKDLGWKIGSQFKEKKCSMSWAPPLVLEGPSLHTDNGWTGAADFGGLYTVPNVKINIPFTSDNLIRNVTYPNLQISVKNLPSGIDYFRSSDSLYLKGIPPETLQNDHKAKVEISFTGPVGSEIKNGPNSWIPYPEYATKVLTVEFSGVFQSLIHVPPQVGSNKVIYPETFLNGIALPAGEGIIGEPITTISLNDHFRYGNGPFVWNWKGRGTHTNINDCGFAVKTEGTDNRFCKITGSPNVKGLTGLIGTVIDEGENGKSLSFEIPFTKISEKLVQKSDINITFKEDGTIDPIDVKDYLAFDPDYADNLQFSDYYGVLGNYGLQISANGVISSTGTLQEGREPGLDYILIKQGNQTAKITVNIGELNIGKLGFDRVKAVKNGKKITVSASANTPVSAANLVDLTDGPVFYGEHFSFKVEGETVNSPIQVAGWKSLKHDNGRFTEMVPDGTIADPDITMTLTASSGSNITVIISAKIV